MIDDLNASTPNVLFSCRRLFVWRSNENCLYLLTAHRFVNKSKLVVETLKLFFFLLLFYRKTFPLPKILREKQKTWADTKPSAKSASLHDDVFFLFEWWTGSETISRRVPASPPSFSVEHRWRRKFNEAKHEYEISSPSRRVCVVVLLLTHVSQKWILMLRWAPIYVHAHFGLKMEKRRFPLSSALSAGFSWLSLVCLIFMLFSWWSERFRLTKS